MIGPEKTWWRVGDERLRSNGHGWVGDGRLGLKRVGRGWDMSGCARIDNVGWKASGWARNNLVESGR